jgi:TonB family protein
MEAMATYLIKSTVWLTGFALVYALFLRNERFFLLNRIYLFSGILAAFVFPLFTWRYTVLLPVVPTVEVSEPMVQGVTEVNEPFPTQNMLLFSLYLSGIIFLVYRVLRQTLPVFRIIRESEKQLYSSAKLIRTAEYPASFSFFSFVFVNPSIDETETREIVNHELEHIRQQHWIDLLLFEILRAVQWFNPAIWLYGHFIRQNHEYLADERALQRSSNPAIYRAALLNQLFGGPVISLANSFNYSLNKKRFYMMKQTISSPLRKLRLLLVFPLIAGVFYAFSAPEYKFIQAEEVAKPLTQNEKTIKGKVTDESGKPLKSASVIISGKTIGTITDNDGKFMLTVTDNSPIVVSYVGFHTAKMDPDFEHEMNFILKTEVVKIGFPDKAEKTATSPGISDKVLIVIDGKKSTKAEMEELAPDKIQSINVLKDKKAAEKYGENSKDGVIEIVLKTIDNSTTPQTFKVQANLPLKFRNTGGAGNQPLHVIDGVITENFNSNNISPESIESISVLKNESATILYGDKGKDGVILITTKKGKIEAENKTIDDNVSGSISNQKKDDVFFIVEEMPEFPGGQEALRAFIKATMQYPEVAKENGIQGKVFVKFVVAKDGSVTDAKIFRGVDPSLDKEALRIVSNLPKWEPGKKGGEAVKVSYTVPVNFQLQEENTNNENLAANSNPGKPTFTMVEEMPQFPGGAEALKAYVASTMKYPVIALENGIHGQVFVKFEVDKTGRVTNARISRGVDPSLDQEAKRIVESMPRWSPGKQNGQAVHVAYEMPINFKFPDDYHPKSKEKLRTK